MHQRGVVVAVFWPYANRANNLGRLHMHETSIILGSGQRHAAVFTHNFPRRPFLSFTGYWGFYIDTRPSGPVVGKEYNPQIFWQRNLACGPDTSTKYEPNPMYGSAAGFSDGSSASAKTSNDDSPRHVERDCYIAIGYNHSSNGQVIDTLQEFREDQHAQGTDAALDAISRGWDYIRFNGRFFPIWSADDRVAIYPTLKYFLNDGFLQGEPEELHDWERPPDAKSRKQVDGIGLLTKYQRRVKGFDAKFVVSYTTGYRDAFRYSTFRLEGGVAILDLPIVLWAQKGYMSDLSQYYRNVTGYGLQLEVGAF